MKHSLFIYKIILITFLVICSVAYSQPKVRFEHLTTKNGLSINSIFSICQDQEGFIWFGTWYGLNKYDGYTFTSFIHNPNNIKTGLLNNSINAIHEDKNGRIWVGTWRGLHLVDKKTEKITPFLNHRASSSIATIYEDKAGTLWLGSYFGSLQKFDLNTKQFTNYDFPRSVISILDDSSGVLWIGSNEGLYKYDPQQNHFTLVPIKNSPGRQPLVTDKYIDREGVMWIGTDGDGLFTIDTRDTSLKVSHYTQQNHINTHVSAILEDNKGLLWVGSTNNGLQSVNRKTNTVVSYKSDPFDPASLNSNNIQSIYMDRTGNIWIGTPDGINKISSDIKPFYNYQFKQSSFTRIADNRVESILQDKTGLIWLAMPTGLIQLDSTLKQIVYFPFNPSDPQRQTGQWVRALYEDRKGQVWIGTPYGLQLFNRSSGKFIKYPFSPSLPSPFTFYSVSEDMKGKLWMGTENGLVSFDPLNNHYSYFQHDPNDSTSLIFNFLRGAMASRSGDIWAFSGGTGISRLDQKTGKFKSYIPGDGTSAEKLNDGDILDMYEDTQGIIWIATSQGGLNRFDPETNLFSYFTTKDGLSSNNIESIIADDKGNLWLGTNRGITRFNPKTKLTTIFNENDGLPDNEFIRQSKYKRNGRLFLGNLNGLVAFNPDSIKENDQLPLIHIKDIKVLGKSMPVNQKKIELSYNENYLSFDFVALSYNTPESNQYAYKLEGLDNDWVYVGTRRYASYTNLNPGKYIFHVKGSNSDGVWNEKGSKVTIIINPPLWATWWAYILYVLFGFGLLFSIRRFELNRRLMQAENKRKSEELEEARQLQLSMLPKELPQLPHLDIAVYMQTATEVGGDYYDFHVSMDGTLTVVIGDATGHGMKAGTMVTTAKSLFNSYASNPDILFSFSEFTRCIKNMNFGRTSMCLTMLKISDHKMQIATAGMPPTYIYRSDSGKVEEYLFKGMPLGAMEKFPYELKETKLKAGDTILLLSDGLPELENSAAEIFGYNKVLSAFEELAQKPPEQIIDQLKNESAAWVNNKAPDDDVTFVVIKVK